MSGIRNTRVRGVAVTALLAALSLVVLCLSAFSPAARMGVVAAAGLVPAGAVISVGLGAGFCCYGVCLYPVKAMYCFICSSLGFIR